MFRVNFATVKNYFELTATAIRGSLSVSGRGSVTCENPRVAERMLVRARTHLDGVSINSGPQFRLFTRRPRLSRATAIAK